MLGKKDRLLFDIDILLRALLRHCVAGSLESNSNIEHSSQSAKRKEMRLTIIPAYPETAPASNVMPALLEKRGAMARVCSRT